MNSLESFADAWAFARNPVLAFEAGESAAEEVIETPLDRERIVRALADAGVSTAGTLDEQAQRLERFFLHEWNKNGRKPGVTSICSEDTNESKGCGRISPTGLELCPFCGSR